VQEELDNNEVLFGNGGAQSSQQTTTPHKDYQIHTHVNKGTSNKNSRNDFKRGNDSVEKMMNNSSTAMTKDYSKYEKADKKMQDAIN